MPRFGLGGEGVTGKTGTESKPSASRASSVVGTSMSTLKPPHRKRRGRVGSVEIGKVAALKAEGFNNSEVSRTLRLSREVVATIAKFPETQLEIAKRREVLKGITIQRVGQILEPAWDMAQKAAKNGDAKSFDAATRGLYAVEKIGASSSGENQRVQVDHTGSVNVSQEPALIQLKALIGVITGAVDPGSLNADNGATRAALREVDRGDGAGGLSGSPVRTPRALR